MSQSTTSDINKKAKKLLESTDYKELNKRIAKEVNVFDILQVSDMEIRHSNMLGWLLDPNKNHGFDDFIIKSLYERISGKSSWGVKYDSFKVLREWRNIDLLLVSNESKIVICIENKVHAGEGQHQLKKYKNIVDEEYSNKFKKYFIYLTIDGSNASESNKEIWEPLSYEFIINTINKALKIYELYPKSEIIINQYLKILERNVMGEEKEIQELCEKIYKENEELIDLIYKNGRKDPTLTARETVMKWLGTLKSSPLNLDEEKSTKSYLRFRSDYFDLVMPQSQDKSGGLWGNGMRYYYEIEIWSSGSVYVIFTLSLKDTPAGVKDKQHIIFDEAQKFKSRRRNIKFNIEATGVRALNFSKAIPLASDENTTDGLDKLSTIFQKEIPAFEEQIKKVLK